MRKYLADSLRRLRREANLTQTELGKRVSLSPGYISLIEKGGRDVSIRQLEQMFAALGISFERILEQRLSERGFISLKTRCSPVKKGWVN